MNLRELAKECPHCMGCGLENPNGDLLCLAHSNALEDGRGAYHKSNDLYGAYLCATCHDFVDGRNSFFILVKNNSGTKKDKRKYHENAWIKTMRWWIDNGHIK